MFKLTVAQRAGLMLQQVVSQECFILSKIYQSISNFFLIEVALMCWNRGLRTETTSSS